MPRNEPVLANKSGYPVLVKLPTGGLKTIPNNAAVAGPGFERYVETRVLTRVGSNYSGGAIVYETPTDLHVAPEPSAKPEAVPAPIVLPVEPVATVEAAVVHSAPVESPKAVLPDASAKRFKVPGSDVLRSLTKKDLSALAERIGIEASGSRSKLLSLLSPLAGKDVEAKVE